MEKLKSKKSFWQSVMSVAVLAIFFILAVGTGGKGSTTTKRHLDGDVVETTVDFNASNGKKKIYTGVEDFRGIRTGPYKIRTRTDYGWMEEEVDFVNGKRTGICKTTFSSGKIEYSCYKNNQSYPCIKAEHNIVENATAFQVLSGKYPWFTNQLTVFGYDNEYVEAYMDTLETILDELGDDPQEFENYYGDAVDSLTYTPYDSLIQLNYLLSEIQGEDEVKSDEFRMAIIDRNRSNDKTTYNIMKATYPGYLEAITEVGVSDPDFKGFCHVADSLMDGDDALYGPLDPENIFFVDSVDERLSRAIVYILNYEDTTSTALKSLKIRAFLNDRNNFRSIYREASSFLVQSAIDSTIQNAAFAALYFMILKYSEGDMIYRSVREAWLNKKGVVSIPIVLTEFSGNNSATSVNLLGEVLEDGGGAVSSRGIAWADFYNPTTSDNSETSGTGLGTFAIELPNLTEGTTYYARAYATNSAGTAYGNCVIFTAGESVGIDENELLVRDFKVYPNPASALTTFSFSVETSEDMALTLINLKGQAVFHHDLGRLLPGENRVELDLSELPNGIYSCQLNNNGTTRSTCKILIAH
jgi:hypothetical protein